MQDKEGHKGGPDPGRLAMAVQPHSGPRQGLGILMRSVGTARNIGYVLPRCPGTPQFLECCGRHPTAGGRALRASRPAPAPAPAPGSPRPRRGPGLGCRSSSGSGSSG